MAGRGKAKRPVFDGKVTKPVCCEAVLLTSLLGAAGAVGGREPRIGAVELWYEKVLDAVENEGSADTASLGAGLALLEDIAVENLLIQEFLDDDVLGLNRCEVSVSSRVPAAEELCRSNSCLLANAASSRDIVKRLILPDTVLPS